MTSTTATTAWRESIKSWPASTRSAWQARVAELAPAGSSLSDLRSARERAFVEFSPDVGVANTLVAGWPLERRREFARLARELSDAGFAPEMAERQSLLAVLDQASSALAPTRTRSR